MINAFISRIEFWGNRLPPPTALFIYLCGFTLLASWLASVMGVSATHPISGDDIAAKSLFSDEGLVYILESAIKNFITFAPVGTMLVAVMGIGVAEHSGLLPELLNRLAIHLRGVYLTFSIALLGVLSSVGADSGYVILIPLAALIFMQANQHPIAGICVAFAGVSAGYSANIIIGPTDIMLAGISTEAIQSVTPGKQVTVTANYYFMAASVLLIAGVITLIHQFFTRHQVLSINYLPQQTKPKATTNSSKALRATGVFIILYILLLLALVLPSDGVLRNATGGLFPSPFINSLIILIAIGAALSGIVYGRFSGQYKRWHSAITAMEQHTATMASYIVLMFFAAQFVNWFNWSQLGLITAIFGAEILKGLPLNTEVTLIAFVFITALINLFIGSASAKWALMAPVFLPMFLLVGISPEATQIAYRIGDSSTNIITPLMPYFGVIIAFMQRYKTDIGSGTIISLMLPYSIGLLLSWLALLLIWLAFDLPFGPSY